MANIDGNTTSIQTLVRKSFKSFLFLSRTTKLEDVDFLMAYDVTQREKLVNYVSKQKWLFRLKGEEYDCWQDPQVQVLQPRSKVVTKCLPKEVTLYSNLLCAMCPKCTGQRMTNVHLNSTHGLKADGLKELIMDLRNLIDKSLHNLSRRQKLVYAKDYVVGKIKVIKAFMSTWLCHTCIYSKVDQAQVFNP